MKKSLRSFLAAKMKRRSLFRRFPAILFSFFIFPYFISSAFAQDKASEMGDLNSAYKNTIRRIEAVIRQIEENDPSFYRIEKDFQRSVNDPMQFGTNGLSHYSSTVNPDVLNFLAKLGFNQTYYWTRYGEGSTIFAESLLGVKYLLSEKDSVQKPYPARFSRNGITVFENPDAFPIGFSAGEGLVLGTDLYASDPFEIQNNIFRSLGGSQDQSLFYQADYAQPRLENLEIVSSGDKIYYKKTDSNADGAIIWDVRIESTDPLYFFLSTPYRGNTDAAEVSVNDGPGEKYLSEDRYGILPLGRFETGEIVTVKLKLLQPELALGEARFSHENIAVLSAFTRELQQGAVTLQKVSSSYLTGTVTVPPEDAYLFFSIPFEEGWTIRVDGIKAKPIRLFGALIAVRVTPGAHSLDLRYRPEQFSAGAVISAGTLVILIGWILLKKRREAELKRSG